MLYRSSWACPRHVRTLASDLAGFLGIPGKSGQSPSIPSLRDKSSLFPVLDSTFKPSRVPSPNLQTNAFLDPVSYSTVSVALSTILWRPVGNWIHYS